MTRNLELLEAIRRKSSMSEEIVSKKDADYGMYSGGSWNISSTMAKIVTFLRSGLCPPDMVLPLKIYFWYLDQQRKAYFASVVCTEVSQLGFILGSEDIELRASKPGLYQPNP